MTRYPDTLRREAIRQMLVAALGSHRPSSPVVHEVTGRDIV
jgi:hypothetical protein